MAGCGSREKVPQIGSLKRLSSFLNYSAGGLGAVACAHDGLPSYERYGMLGERLAGACVSRRNIEWSSESGRNVLSEFLEYDRAGRFVGEYMTKVDGATMFHSLEARSPFLDQDLWEFAAGLSFETASARRTAEIDSARAGPAEIWRSTRTRTKTRIYDSGATVARRPLAQRADRIAAILDTRSRRLDKLPRRSRSLERGSGTGPGPQPTLVHLRARILATPRTELYFRSGSAA